MRVSDAYSSSPERVSRQRPSRAAKWKPPLRAATQISRFAACRFTMMRDPSGQVMVRMPLSTSASSSSRDSTAASMRSSTASAARWKSVSFIMPGMIRALVTAATALALALALAACGQKGPLKLPDPPPAPKPAPATPP